MKCPKCARRLKSDATTCLCGWGGETTATKIIPCHFADQGCTRPARLRTDRYSLGNVQWPLCFEHLDQLHSEHAEAWCTAHNLNTREQRIAFCNSLKHKPKPTARELWLKVLANPKAPVIAHEMARQALATFTQKH